MNLTKRQKEIVKVATILTAEGGIQNLTIKNIADRLNISEPAIYRHFSNKSTIVKSMIKSFDNGVREEKEEIFCGFSGIENFAKKRFAQAVENPALAKVMFSEELFMDDESYSNLMMEMVHQHKLKLKKYFLEAQRLKEIRSDISLDMLFRLFFGPVRLLVKQWGMSNYTFNLIEKGDELLQALRKTLKG